MWKEFKEFAFKGNMLDLAIGIIIGAAFGKIVTSLVNDIIMPPIGLLLGKIDFASLYINLSGKQYPTMADAAAAGAPIIKYGSFINTIVDFLIVGFVLFLVVKYVNKIRRQEQPAPPDTRDCPYCFTAIPRNASRCPNCTSNI